MNSRKSPTAEMGVQVNQKDGNRRNNNRGQQGGRMDSQGSHENRVSSIRMTVLIHFEPDFVLHFETNTLTINDEINVN